MRPQASEGEAQHGLFCWTRCVGQGNEHLSGASGLLVAPPGGSNPYLHSEQFCAQEVAKNKATSPRGRPTHQQRTKKMKGFGDGALSNFHFPKVPPPGVAPPGHALGGCPAGAARPGGKRQPHASIVSLLPKLVCDALDSASPDPERLGHLAIQPSAVRRNRACSSEVAICSALVRLPQS